MLITKKKKKKDDSGRLCDEKVWAESGNLDFSECLPTLQGHT